MRSRAGARQSGSGPTAIGGMLLAMLPILAVALAVPRPAAAGFRVCNQTLDLLNVAIGRPSGDGFETEGWWVVTANSCASLIRRDLASRYLYLFVTDVYGQSVVDGDTSMCVGRRKFRITGIEQCWARGFDRAGFKEVDTFDSPDWTVFVTK